MTTDGTDGVPESAAENDPFAYLYRPAEGQEAAPGQPRSAYSRPMEVGRAHYGDRAPGYGAQPPAAPRPTPPQSPQYGQAAPTVQVPQQSRYAERSRPQPGEERPAGGRGKATVIGAVAVVAAIAIGAGIALSTGDGGKTDNGTGGTGASHSSAPASSTSSSAASASAPPSAATTPQIDASKLQAQGAASANTVKGAVSADGSYLTLQAGSTVTWSVSVPTAGQYKLWLHYNNAGADTPAVVTVNGQPHTGGVTLKNWSSGNTDPSRAWFSTNIWPQLQAGTNTFTVSVPAGGSGSALLDQVALTTMDVSQYPSH